MDSRTALFDNTVLVFGDNKSFTVEKELARGGSNIVYSAFYIDNAGCRNPVLIKECYPFRCRISRSEDNSLNVSENDKEIFLITKDRLLNAYKLGNSFFCKSGLTNLTANTYEVYYANNTMYIISAYLRGQELSYNRYNSVKDCVSVVKRIASTIRLIHNAGYLYLDIKPDNVFTLDETTDIIQLFDFDSLIPIDRNSRGNSELYDHISYTKGYAALELQKGDYRKIGKQTDVYGVGAVLFYLIFNRIPSAADCSMDSVFVYEKSKNLSS